MMLAVGESYDLQYDGKLFGMLWEQEKAKSSFNWQNKDKKHDAFKAHDFGQNLDSVNKPTSREVGFSKSIEVHNSPEEEKKNFDDLSPTSRQIELAKAESRAEHLKEKERRKSQK